MARPRSVGSPFRLHVEGHGLREGQGHPGRARQEESPPTHHPCPKSMPPQTAHHPRHYPGSPTCDQISKRAFLCILGRLKIPKGGLSSQQGRSAILPGRAFRPPISLPFPATPAAVWVTTWVVPGKTAPRVPWGPPGSPGVLQTLHPLSSEPVCLQLQPRICRGQRHRPRPGGAPLRARQGCWPMAPSWASSLSHPRHHPHQNCPGLVHPPTGPQGSVLGVLLDPRPPSAQASWAALCMSRPTWAPR